MGTMGRKPGEKIKNLCIFALPGCFVFCAVVIVPFIYGFYLTLTDWNGVSQEKNMVGLTNYIAVFKDAEFWSSMGLTLKYVLFSVILVNIIGFILAYALTNGLRGQNFPDRFFYTKSNWWCCIRFYLAVYFFKSTGDNGPGYRLGNIINFLACRSE